MGLEDRDWYRNEINKKTKPNQTNHFRNQQNLKKLKSFKENKKTSTIKNIIWSIVILGGLLGIIELIFWSEKINFITK
jgi:hypothetical protein